MDDSVAYDPRMAPGAPVADDADASDRVERVLAWWKEGRDHWREWRVEAKDAYDLIAGRQYSAEEEEQLKAQKRPAVVFNRSAPVIDSVVGSESQNRQHIQYFPRMVNDSGVNETLTNAAKYVRDRGNFDLEESDAFRDALICGIGATQLRLSYDENPDGEIEKERLDPFEVIPDPSARKRNFVDGKRVMRERWVPCAAVHAEFPDKAADLELAANAEDEEKTPVDATRQDYDEDLSSHYRPSRKEYRLIECEWAEYRPYFRVADPMQNGKLVDMDTAGMLKAQIAAKALGMPFRYVPAKRWEWKRSIICGRTELQYGPAPSAKGPSIRFITGLRDRNQRTFYGLVRAMKDPQRWANKWLSQVMHIINSNAKGGVLFEAGAFDNAQKAREEWARPDAMVQTNAGAISGGRIQQRQAITYPAGLDQLMQFAVSAIRDVTGVNLEMLGLADRQQAGVLEAQRKQAALTILATWFEALRAYRRADGFLLLDYIRQYISDGRLIRIDDENAPRYLPLIRDPDTFEYDVIVDTAPSSVNVKQQTFEVLQTLMPALAKFGIKPPAEVLQYLPLPESLGRKWAEEMGGGGVPPEVKQQMQEMQGMLQQGKQELDATKAENEQMKQAAAIKDREHQLELASKELDKRTAELEAKYARAEQRMSADAGVAGEQMMPMVDQRIAEVLQAVLGQFRQQIAADVQAIVNAPKSFEYGPDGLVVSMNGRPVTRDSSGRLVGLQ